MKTLNDLFALVAQAVGKNQINHNTWFIEYHGHINQIEIRHWKCGWDPKYPASEQTVRQYLTEEGIQSAYWFIKTRL